MAGPKYILLVNWG